VSWLSQQVGSSKHKSSPKKKNKSPQKSFSDTERPTRGQPKGDEVFSLSQPVLSPRKRFVISIDSDPEEKVSSHSSDEVDSADEANEDGTGESSPGASLEKKLLDFIQRNQELYLHVLQYKPINILTLHEELKENGIKCSQKTLGTFLDFQGCTFIVPKTEKEKEKQRHKSQTRQSYLKRKKKPQAE